MGQNMLVFMGGTCGKNHWRKPFIEAMGRLGVPPECFFDPVVENWNEEAQANEERAKKEATHLLFYLASPMQDGPFALSAYSMVEATMGLYDKPETLVIFNREGIEGHALKSFKQTERVLRTRFPYHPIFELPGDAMHWLKREYDEWRNREHEEKLKREHDAKQPAPTPAPPPPAYEEDKGTPLDVCGRCGKLWFEHTEEKEPPSIKDLCEGFTKWKKSVEP